MTRKKEGALQKIVVLLMIFMVFAAYIPSVAFAANTTTTKASVYDGGTLKGSDGKPYYPNQKGGGYYWAKFSNAAGTGFVYRLARANAAKKSIVVDTGKSKYQGYCLEHGAWMNAGATGYSAKEQEDLMELRWMKPYSEKTREGMRLALLFGKQPGHTQKDVPVEGCNLDDWYWATQNIIWEFQQGLRTSVDSGLKSRTGKYAMDANWFRDTVKGRPAGKIYDWMLLQMKKYKKIPSFTTESAVRIKNKHIISLIKQDDGTWIGRVNDRNKISQDIKSINKHIKIKRNGNEYSIICDVDPAKITGAIKATKAIDVSVPKRDLLVFSTNQASPIADSNHLQTVACGADDPVVMYFKVKGVEETEPEPGQPEEPKLPSFELDVEKLDANLGFDGDTHTGMGDAALDATIDLLIDGEVTDSKILNVNGYSDEPFYLMPWEDISELHYETVEHEGDEEKGEAAWTEHIWTGSKTITTRESMPPNGRFPDKREHSHGAIQYYAHTNEKGEILYNITYENGILTSVDEIDLDNPQPMRDDKGVNAFVNDNFRGQLQIIKTKTDLDPFTPDNGSGKLEYSTNSKWTIRLNFGGYEDCPYIRVVPITKGVDGFSAYANNYRVVRDGSGEPADEQHSLTVSRFGQINIVDLPYGNYTVQEISADSNGYVLESHEVTVTEDGQLISTDTDNVPKKNKVQIIKTNAETGKSVRLSENAAFRVKYLGNPDLQDPKLSPNYGKYLPNGTSYTDGDAISKNQYIFRCNEDGQIVLPYQLEYGIYQLEEVTAPEGYFIGSYDEAGISSSTEMPKDFSDAVVIYDSAGERITDFTANGKVIFNKYKFTVSEQTPHQDGKDYVTYYLTVKMPNNPVKGKIQITKYGESLAGWLAQRYDAGSGYTAVWDRTKLKNTTFNVYAAEDVRQVDGVERITAYDAKTNEEIPLEEATRDHSGKEDARSFWQKLLDTGEKILRWLGLDIGDDNECRTEYIAKAEKGASYSTDYTIKENGITVTYHVTFGMSYTKGGMNYTDVHIKKDMIADDYVTGFDITEPVLKSGESEADILNLILENRNMIKLNQDTVNEYGDDVTAEIKKPMTTIRPIDLDEEPGVSENWKLVRKADKYLAEKEVQDENEDGTPKVDENEEPIMKKIYKVYVDDNGENKWVDCDENGSFEDVNQPKDLPEGYSRTEQDNMYQISKRTDTGTVYMVWAVEDGKGKWIPCDEDGHFYKSHHQEYGFTLTQHFDCQDGFVLNWDGIALDAKADHEKQEAKTIITNPFGTVPEITCTDAYTAEAKDSITTFTAAPKDAAPVYFKTHNGIKTSMIYQGGQTVTTMEVLQSQLYQFGEDSKPEDTTSTEKILPMIEYTGEEETELLEWCKNFTPDDTEFERVFDENNYIKVQRHEVSPEYKEVTYEITLVSNNADEEKGFKVTYPDTTTMQPLTCIDEGQAAGKLLFISMEGTMVYPIGSPVATITTDENGVATTPNLPLGKYYVQEVKSSNGHINNGQWQEFNLTYKDQYTPLVWNEVDFDNESVSVKIDLTKLLETGYETKKYEPGGGAVFGVFTGEEIAATTKTDKKIDRKSIEADTLVGTISIMGDGTGTTVAKLPQGKYYVKELTAPSGYMLNGTKYYFNVTDVLTADHAEFSYDALGIRGVITKDDANTVIDIETLYSKPMRNIVIDGKEYDLLQNLQSDAVIVKVLKGRIKTKIIVSAGKDSMITFADGSTLNITGDKTTYTAAFAGTAPKLDLGSETNLTKTVEDGIIKVTYQPKVTKTNWLTEMTYDYVEPKEHATEEEKARVTSLVLTSPEGTAAVQADIDYDYRNAHLTFPQGTVSGITLDGKSQKDLEAVVLERVHIEPAEQEGEPDQMTVKTSTAVINFADGTAYTVTLDESGQYTMDASGEADKEFAAESVLTVDGKTELPKEVNLKNTVAKTYARNNTNAGILNVTIKSIKNDKLPDTPVPMPAPLNPSIKTTALDKETGSHFSYANGKVTLLDEIRYTDLTVGKEYTAKGMLMNPVTKKPYQVDGKPVTGETVFIPETTAGSIKVEFSFVVDKKTFTGLQGVIFEELYCDGMLVCEHKDYDDTAQTIYFPRIKTIAEHTEINRIEDQVQYWSLVAGEDYTLLAVLMDKHSKNPVYSFGKKVMAELDFTADATSGAVVMPLKFDEKALYGKETVVFEYLYYKGKLIASHEDWNDRNQTVVFPKKPRHPEKPKTPEKPKNPDAPLTGDETALEIYLLVCIAMALGLSLVMGLKINKKHDREDVGKGNEK